MTPAVLSHGMTGILQRVNKSNRICETTFSGAPDETLQSPLREVRPCVSFVYR